jgi:hypothetical protein
LEFTVNRITMFLLSFLLLGWAASSGAAQFPRAYDRLKPLAWKVGDWVTEYQAAADSGPIKKGETVKVHFSLRWSPDRSFLVNTSSAEVNGRRVATGLEVISWDHEKSAIRHSYFGTWGTGQGVWTKVGDTAELDWTIHGPHGTFKGHSWASRQGDTWKWQIKDQTRNGEAMPDMPVAIFLRKKGEPAGDLWKAYCEVAAGSWTGTATVLEDSKELGLVKGQTFLGGCSLLPELGGKVLVGEMHFEAVGKLPAGKSRILAGWDPASRQVRFLSMWGDGMVEELLLSKQEGTAFLGTYSAKNAGEAPQQSRVRVDYSNADTCVLTFLDGSKKGMELSTWKRQATPGAGPSTPALLKEYAILALGEWECKESRPWGSPPGAPTVPVRATLSWTLGGAALESDLKVGDGRARSLICFDPATKQLKSFAVGSTGDCIEASLTKKDDKWFFRATMIALDGRRTEIRMATTFAKDGKSHVNEYADHKDVFTRVTVR